MNPAVQSIIEAVLPHFGLEQEGAAAMMGRDRHKAYADARNVCMWLARRRTRLSFPEIAREFGNRDHTTVMTAVRRIEERIAKDPEGKVATVARFGMVAALGAWTEVVGRQHGGGSREVTFDPMPPVKIELDDEPHALGAAG